MLWIHKSLSFPFSFFYHIFGKVYKIHCLCKCSLPVVNNEACGKSYLCSSSSLQNLVCRLLFSSCSQVKDSLSSSYVNLRAFLLFLSRPWTNCLAVFWYQVTIYVRLLHLQHGFAQQYRPFVYLLLKGRLFTTIDSNMCSLQEL